MEFEHAADDEEQMADIKQDRVLVNEQDGSARDGKRQEVPGRTRTAFLDKNFC